MATILSDEKCDDHASWLAITSCIMALAVMVIAVPMNSVVLVAILKNKKFHTKFHLIICNISFADFLIGVISCPLSIDFHVGVIQNVRTSNFKKQTFRFCMVALGTASILSMTVLSIDRMISLKYPKKYREMKRRYFIVSIAVVWLATVSVSPVYLVLNFTLYLTIVSITIVLVTTIVMVITYQFYRKNLQESYNRTYSISDKVSIPNDTEINRKTSQVRKGKERVSRVSNTNQPEYQIYLIEKRATNTFFYMMLVFLLCYMPIVGTSIYLYSCLSCDCYVNQIVRECIASFFICSSFLKTTMFLVRLTALRKSCANLFISKKELERRWRSDSNTHMEKKQVVKKTSVIEKLLQRKKTYDTEV